MIKNIILTGCFFIIFLNHSITSAQMNRPGRMNCIKMDFLAPIAFQEVGFAYERVFTGDLSAQLGFQIIDEGFSLNPGIKYYPFRRLAPEGFFIHPFGRIMRGSISMNIGFGFGGLVGYQYLIANRVTVSGFIGPAYNGLAAEYAWEPWGGVNVGLLF